MKNATITKIADGLVEIRPKKGYQLYHEPTQRHFSEARVEEKNIAQFEAVKKGK